MSTALVGTINFLTTFLAILLVDKASYLPPISLPSPQLPLSLQIGRKALLLLGALGMFLSICAAANVILIWKVDEDGSSQVAGYIVVLFICLFVFNFAYGWG